MTNEEAIELLKNMHWSITTKMNREAPSSLALLMAIKALDKDINVPSKWIPVSERLPEEPFGCLVTVWDEQPMTGEMFENLLPYFVGWDGEQWNDGDGMQCPFEIIAWMPLPAPWKGEGE